MTIEQAIIEWLRKRGTEPSRTKEDFEDDARGIVKALEEAGFTIVPQPPRS